MLREPEHVGQTLIQQVWEKLNPLETLVTNNDTSAMWRHTGYSVFMFLQCEGRRRGRRRGRTGRILYTVYDTEYKYWRVLEEV